MDAEDDEEDSVSDCNYQQTRRWGASAGTDGRFLGRCVSWRLGGPGVGATHPPDSQSLRPEHHPTQNLFPFMETVFH